MNQFRFTNLPENLNTADRQNFNILKLSKLSSKQNLQTNKQNSQSYKDQLLSEDLENLKKINKQQQQTINFYKNQIEQLKNDLQQNKTYTTLLQQKYTILLETVQPHYQKINIQSILLRNIELQNELQKIKRQNKLQSLQSLKLSECQNYQSISLNKVTSLKVQEQNKSHHENIYNLRSQNLLHENISQLHNTASKTQHSQIGIQVLLQQQPQQQQYIIKRRKTLSKVTDSNPQINHSNNMNLSRKRKNSQSQQAQSYQWQKIINQFSKIQQDSPLNFRNKTQSLLKKSIPYDLRSTVWPMIFSNDLNITVQFYMELLQRRSNNWVEESVKIQIQKDLNRSFTGKGQDIQNKDKLIEQVRQVLELFHLYRPDVSYVQGMTYPVIVLISVVGKMKAFSILANQIIGIPFFKRLYSFQGNYLTIYCRTFDLLLKQTNQKIYETLKKKNINSEIFLIQWFYTFFSRGMHFQTILKIWDHLAYYQEVVFFKIALTIIQVAGPYIIQASYEDSISLIKQFPSYIDEKKLIQTFIQNKITSQRFKRTYKKVLSTFTLLKN